MKITPKDDLLHRDLHKMLKAVTQRLEADDITGVIFIAYNTDSHTAIICNPAIPEKMQVNILSEMLKLIASHSDQEHRLRIGGDEA